MPVLGILLRTISLLRLCFPPSGNDSVSWNLPTHSSSPPPCSLPSSTVAFRTKCKIFSRHLQKPILKKKKDVLKGCKIPSKTSFSYCFFFGFRFPCSSTIRSFPVILCWFGTYSMRSEISHSNTSQILSTWSRFIRVTNSWYHSLIVLGRIPVASARSFCVHLFSPRSRDKWILIMISMPLCWLF